MKKAAKLAAALFLASLVAAAAARDARAGAETLGQWNGDVRLTYTGSYAHRFFESDAKQSFIPLFGRGRYNTEELTLGGDLGVLDWLDVNASFSAAWQQFTDSVKADRQDIFDLDSFTAGAKAKFLDKDPLSMAFEYALVLPISTSPRKLYASSSIDDTLKLDATLTFTHFYLSGYTGFTFRTGNYTDLWLLGVEPGLTFDPITLYMPIDYETPIDHTKGKPEFGRGVLNEPNPTTLTVGLGFSWKMTKVVTLDLFVSETVFGMNALRTELWSVTLSFNF